MSTGSREREKPLIVPVVLLLFTFLPPGISFNTPTDRRVGRRRGCERLGVVERFLLFEEGLTDKRILAGAMIRRRKL